MSTRTAPDQFLERDGARLRWRRQGSGSAIMLLHGWALDLDAWNPVASRLAAGFTVLRFDRCGFGLSTGRPDIHRNVADLRAVLAAAGSDRVVLVGMSQGARLAIHFALEHPALVRALVLDGAPALDAEPELPMDELRQLLAGRGQPALREALSRHPLMRLETRDGGMHTLLETVIARYRGLDLQHPAVRGRPPDLGRIASPTLILNGERDTPARLAAAATLQTSVPGSRRALIAGAGHLALLDDPRAYADAVATFCTNLPP